MRHHSTVDLFVKQADLALALLFKKPLSGQRDNPGMLCAEPELNLAETKHVIGLMRVNHAGEVAAQGLYQGQALTAHLDDIRDHMNQAAEEEIDHLAWCRERVEELGGNTSIFDPVWYLGAVLIGALAGIAGDSWSLGFIAETEKQVTAHLEDHLKKLPEQDHKSRHILAQMAFDETQHANNAIAAGGRTLPWFIQQLMRLSAKVMVNTAYKY